MRLFATAAAVLLSLASAAKFEGVANSNVGFAYLGKFVFDVGQPGGSVSVKLSVPKELRAEPYEIWLFDDEEVSWPSIYQHKPPVSCQEARTRARNYDPATGKLKNAYKVEFGEDGHWGPVASNINQYIRPRYWFVIAAHCTDDGEHVIRDLTYEVVFTNTQKKGWDMQFGTNESGLQTLYLAFFLFYIPFIVLHFYGVRQLSQKLEYVHPMVKLFALILVLAFVSVTLNMVHYVGYSGNGVGTPSLLLGADLIDLFGRTFFVLMLMLMAKGWTISGDELTGKTIVLLVTGLFFTAALLIFIWQNAVEDEAATHIPGAVQVFIYLVNFIWLCFSFWFASTIWKSYSGEDNPVKKSLYRNLAIVYFPWFFGLPLSSFLTLILNPWSADKFVQTVTITISTLGYAIMSFLLWPSRAEEYFNISTPDVMKGEHEQYDQL